MEVNKLFFMQPAFRAKLILRDLSKMLKTEITAISWQNARVCQIRTIRDVPYSQSVRPGKLHNI